MNSIKEIFKIEDVQDLPTVIYKILFSSNKDVIFKALLKAFNEDLSYDWFQNLYEDELAQRNQNKQDFTPNSVGVLLSYLTGSDKGKIYEPTAGNGSLIIANWWFRKKNNNEYNPLENPVECWELSNRSLPILLLNLSIRNIEGIVYHGNVLEKEIKNIYELKTDSKFSTINKIPLL